MSILATVLSLLRFPFIVTLLTLLLNFAGYLFIAVSSWTVNEYSIYEYCATSFEYGLVVLVFHLFARSRYTVLIFPTLWMLISIVMIVRDYMNGYDFVFSCNTAWGRIYCLIYSMIAQPGMNRVIDESLVIGLFFVYQVCLHYGALRISSLVGRERPPSSR